MILVVYILSILAMLAKNNIINLRATNTFEIKTRHICICNSRGEWGGVAPNNPWPGAKNGTKCCVQRSEIPNGQWSSLPALFSEKNRACALTHKKRASPRLNYHINRHVAQNWAKLAGTGQLCLKNLQQPAAMISRAGKLPYIPRVLYPSHSL